MAHPEAGNIRQRVDAFASAVRHGVHRTLAV
jgi:hypothetical protein